MLSYHCAILPSSENLIVKKIFLKFKLMNQHSKSCVLNKSRKKNMTPESINIGDVGKHLETFDGT